MVSLFETQCSVGYVFVQTNNYLFKQIVYKQLFSCPLRGSVEHKEPVATKHSTHVSTGIELLML